LTTPMTRASARMSLMDCDEIESDGRVMRPSYRREPTRSLWASSGHGEGTARTMRVDSMRNVEGLFELSDGVVDVPPGLNLVAALTGVADAGGAVSQFGVYLLDELDNRTIVTFDNDELLAYRARRPIMSFEQDHLTEYEPARLAISLVHDELG